MEAVTGALPIGITFMIEGEEEDGSKHLPAFVVANRERLKADIALVCDTSMWDQGTPQITTGLRGMVYEELTIKAANRDLHSGLYGGGAQNPIRVLNKIIADLHDTEGRVTLENFYVGVPETPKQVLDQWASLGLTSESFLKPIGLSEPAGEKGRMLIEMVQSRPTCDVNGIIGGYTGVGAKTVIAAEASAKVSFRLVGDQDPAKIRDAFHAHVHVRLPKDCTVEFISHKGSPAITLPFDMPDLVAAKSALHEEWALMLSHLGPVDRSRLLVISRNHWVSIHCSSASVWMMIVSIHPMKNMMSPVLKKAHALGRACLRLWRSDLARNDEFENFYALHPTPSPKRKHICLSPKPGPILMARGMRATRRSWARAVMRFGWVHRCLMARVTMMASCLILVAISSALIVRRKQCI